MLSGSAGNEILAEPPLSIFFAKILGESRPQLEYRLGGGLATAGITTLSVVPAKFLPAFPGACHQSRRENSVSAVGFPKLPGRG